MEASQLLPMAHNFAFSGPNKKTKERASVGFGSYIAKLAIDLRTIMRVTSLHCTGDRLGTR